ncbi:hypothetical protein VHEMI09644 [[Torrubiella] hemipterigena]|uniref:Uncharacterized protein n=1 Tax=[Torrubiella] hemipterigena TaxID=1531966 RepID=A0A0A1TQF0_9HYPO|nr:hypothetical protein VHEMI09644 [[Torrubiella] hemipterigena]
MQINEMPSFATPIAHLKSRITPPNNDFFHLTSPGRLSVTHRAYRASPAKLPSTIHTAGSFQQIPLFVIANYFHTRATLAPLPKRITEPLAFDAEALSSTIQRVSIFG